MSKLIDVDALFIELLKNTEWCDNQDREIALDKILDAPVINDEFVRHARWAHLGGDEWCCTWCGKVITTEGSWEKPDWYKFCYDCGAKIDMEETY